MDAQNAIDQQNNAVDIQIDDDSQPVPPSRRKKDDRRRGEKTEEELEDEAQDILERLKKLWALENWAAPLCMFPVQNSRTNKNSDNRQQQQISLCVI